MELLCELKSLNALHRGMNTWYPKDRKYTYTVASDLRWGNGST